MHSFRIVGPAAIVHRAVPVRGDAARNNGPGKRIASLKALPVFRVNGDCPTGVAVETTGRPRVSEETSITSWPFQAANPLDTLLQVFEREAIALTELAPTIPKDLETICLKSLQKDRSKRYEFARNLAADIGRWELAEPIRARAVSRTERVWRSNTDSSASKLKTGEANRWSAINP